MTGNRKLWLVFCLVLSKKRAKPGSQKYRRYIPATHHSRQPQGFIVSSMADKLESTWPAYRQLTSPFTLTLHFPIWLVKYKLLTERGWERTVVFGFRLIKIRAGTAISPNDHLTRDSLHPSYPISINFRREVRRKSNIFYVGFPVVSAEVARFEEELVPQRTQQSNTSSSDFYLIHF